MSRAATWSGAGGAALVCATAVVLIAAALASCSNAVTRPVAEDSDVNDTASSVEETFAVESPAAPDLLFVLNSSNMNAGLFKINARAPTLLTKLKESGADWHIGAITMDVNDAAENGKLHQVGGHAFLDPSTPNPTDAFATLVQVGDRGSLTGAGLRATARALFMPTPELKQANAGFVRPGDRVVIIVVSDDDDESMGIPTPEAFTEQMLAAPGPSSVTFHAIVGPDPDGCSWLELHALPGTTYSQVATALGGESFSICGNDFDSMYETIARDACRLPESFTLAAAPNPATMRVWLSTEDNTTDGVGGAQMHPGEALIDACARREGYSCFRYDVTGTTLTVDPSTGWTGGTLHVEYFPAR